MVNTIRGRGEGVCSSIYFSKMAPIAKLYVWWINFNYNILLWTRFEINFHVFFYYFFNWRNKNYGRLFLAILKWGNDTDFFSQTYNGFFFNNNYFWQWNLTSDVGQRSVLAVGRRGRWHLYHHLVFRFFPQKISYSFLGVFLFLCTKWWYFLAYNFLKRHGKVDSLIILLLSILFLVYKGFWKDLLSRLNKKLIDIFLRIISL